MLVSSKAPGARPLISGVRPLIARVDWRRVKFVATGNCNRCSLESFAAFCAYSRLLGFAADSARTVRRLPMQFLRFRQQRQLRSRRPNCPCFWQDSQHRLGCGSGVVVQSSRPSSAALTIQSRGTRLFAIFKRASGAGPLISGVRRKYFASIISLQPSPNIKRRDLTWDLLSHSPLARSRPSSAGSARSVRRLPAT